MSAVTLDVAFGSPLPPIEIANERLRLRLFTFEDLDTIEAASTDDHITTITTVPSNYSPDEGRAFIERQNSRLSAGAGWSLAIDDQHQSQAVGQIGLWISDMEKGRATIGYWIATPHRGNGVASEALRMLSDWAFENLRIHRLSLYVEPWNLASIRTAERAGYQREALLQSWERINGIPKDMWSYVQVRPDESV